MAVEIVATIGSVGASVMPVAREAFALNEQRKWKKLIGRQLNQF